MMSSRETMSETRAIMKSRLVMQGRGARITGCVLIGLITIGALAGCDRQGEEYLEGLPHPRLIAELEERAHDLAHRQHEYFESYEEEHRNEVRFHEIKGQPFREGEGVYAKDYREFIGYSIDDILRSESYRTPVEMVITYYYEWYTTPPRESELGRILLDLDPTLVAESDSEFSLRNRYRMTRRYLCDSSGEYRGVLETPLPLENYYVDVGEPTEDRPAFEFASE